MENNQSKISSAISTAMSAITILGKDDANKHGGYNFASIDKFLEMVNPICHKNGLFVTPNIISCDTFKNEKQTLYGIFTIEMTIRHGSGESLPPSRQIIFLPITGAQATGSVQSYALKQFYRAVFNIPTGDKDDADFNAPEEIKAEKIQANIDALLNKIKGAQSVADLTKTWNGLTADEKKTAEIIDAVKSAKKDLQDLETT